MLATCLSKKTLEDNTKGLGQDVNGGEYMNESRDLSSNSSGSKDLTENSVWFNCQAHSHKALCLFRLFNRGSGASRKAILHARTLSDAGDQC
jgi:hypothetical protein